jgi:transcriptional regulator with PAS, ATPase and Fis domain
MSEEKQKSLSLQPIIDTHSHPFVLVDENYTIVAANKAYCTVYGTTSEEIVGKKCHSVSHHFDTPCFMNGEDCPLSTTLRTNELSEVLHIHFDQHNQPEHVRIKGHPVTDSEGNRYVGEEVIRLAKAAELDCEEQKLIGRSRAFRECIEQLSKAADADANIMIVGESGVGKSLAAHYIHNRSSRAGRPFVMMDCRSVNEALFESELFGHERGAFAGCVGRRRGLIDEADGGTLYLEEVGDLPLVLQGRLLNAIESGRFRRVGGRDFLQSNARIIASSHRDLPAMIADNQFRPDLYYRLSGIKVRIPSLRERPEDIHALADSLLIRMRDPKAYRCHIDDDAKEKLVGYAFPGNIRELRNILQRAVALSTDGRIGAEHIELGEMPGPETGAPTQQNLSMQELESRHIAALLIKHQGHRRKVSDELGISERTLYRKLKKFGLEDLGST